MTVTIDQINSGYIFTLIISLSAVVSGIAILTMGSKNEQQFFCKRKWAYAALIASMAINCFFIYNILLWLSIQYVKIDDSEFHIRWLVYHTMEKLAIFMFHHDLYRRVKKWRAENGITRQ